MSGVGDISDGMELELDGAWGFGWLRVVVIGRNLLWGVWWLRDGFSSSSWIEWGFQIFPNCSFCCAFVHELTVSSRLVHLGTNVRLSKILLVQLFVVILHQCPYQKHTDHTRTTSVNPYGPCKNHVNKK